MRRAGRVLGGAVLLELSLLAVTIPVGELFGSPFAFSPAARGRDPRIFFAVVPAACLVLGYVVSRWATRPMTGHRLRHGALLALVATSLYLVMITGRPGGVSMVVMEYGLVGFATAQACRIVGCVAGARPG